MKNCGLFNILEQQVPKPKDRVDVDLEDWIARHDLSDAIEDYSRDGYKFINSRLYRGDKLEDLHPDYAKLAKLFEAKGDITEQTVYRGTLIEDKILKELRTLRASNSDRVLVHSNMITSTSHSKHVAEDFKSGVLGTRSDVSVDSNTQVMMEVYIAKDSYGYDISIYHSDTGEAEVLLPPSSVYELRRMTRDTLYLTLLPDSLTDLMHKTGAKVKTIKGLMSMTALIPLVEGIQDE